jgi:hypothetical protein
VIKIGLKKLLPKIYLAADTFNLLSFDFGLKTLPPQLGHGILPALTFMELPRIFFLHLLQIQTPAYNLAAASGILTGILCFS